MAVNTNVKTIVRSATGFIKMRDTVLITIREIGPGIMSSQDVFTVIAAQFKRQHDKELVTEDKIQNIMKEFAREIKKGYRYRGFGKLTTTDGYWFEYR